MRKNIFIYTAGMALLLSACKKNETDYLFDKPIDERITESLNSYQDALSKAPGWRLFVYPQGLKSAGVDMGGFTYYVQFTQDNRVKMVSDFQADMAKTSAESGFRLKAIQRPSLFFDTYSYIHVAADPNAYISQSPTGQNGAGWGSDFTFAFTEAKPTSDTIVLEGIQNGSQALLVKVSAGEIDSALNKGALRTTIDAMMNYADQNQFLSLPLANNNKAALSIDPRYKLLNLFYRNDKNELITIESGFAFTTRGIWLKNPLNLAGYTFREILWDQQNKYLYIISGGNKVILSSNATPVLSFSLTSQIGKQFKSVIIPVSPLFGQSSAFTSAYATAKANIKNGGYNLDLGNMFFNFDASTNRMTLNTYVSQYGNQFLAQTSYTYTIVGDAIRFTKIAENQNAGFISTDMAPLYNYFTTDSFKLNAMSTTSGFLGQFTSNESPSFYFSGYLQ